MTDIFALWLPILVSTVLVFVASSIIHMAPLWHRNELPSPPDGDRMQDALRPLVQWFICIVVVTALVAYVAGATLAADAAYLAVFRVAGTTAFIAYAAGCWPQSIWYHRPWSTTLKFTLDGLIYGLLTGGAFGWLWSTAG
jgi:hypothetical protein